MRLAMAASFLSYQFHRTHQRSLKKDPAQLKSLLLSLKQDQRILYAYIPHQPDYQIDFPPNKLDPYTNSKKHDLQGLRQRFKQLAASNPDRNNSYVLLEQRETALGLDLTERSIGSSTAFQTSSRLNHNAVNTVLFGSQFYTYRVGLQRNDFHSAVEQSSSWNHRFVNTDQDWANLVTLLQKLGLYKLLVYTQRLQNNQVEQTVMKNIREFQQQWLRLNKTKMRTAYVKPHVFKKMAVANQQVEVRMFDLQIRQPSYISIFDKLRSQHKRQPYYKRYSPQPPFKAATMAAWAMDPQKKAHIECSMVGSKIRGVLGRQLDQMSEGIVLVYRQDCFACKIMQQNLLKLQLGLPVVKVHVSTQCNFGMPTYTPYVFALREGKPRGLRQLTIAELEQGVLQSEILNLVKQQ